MHLAGDARPVQADFSWSIDYDGYQIKGDGTYRENEAGDFELNEHYRGAGSSPSPLGGSFGEMEDSKLIVTGSEAYILSSAVGLEWIKFTPEELSTDWDVVRRLATGRSPVGYGVIVQGVGNDPTELGTEFIRGHRYRRYSGDVDANALMQALADAYGTQGQTMFVNRFSGPVKTDLWIDPATSLPRRIRSDGTITYEHHRTRVILAVDYTDLSSAVTISPPPTYTLFRDAAARN